MNIRFIASLALFFLLLVKINAQKTDSLKSPNRLKAIVLPIVFYSPDTKLGGGAAALLTFNFPNCFAFKSGFVRTFKPSIKT